MSPIGRRPAMNDGDRPLLLVLVYLSPEHQELVARHYDAVYAPSDGNGKSDRTAVLEQVARHGARVRVVLTNGAFGLTPQEMDGMPLLELVCSVGVGYESIAVDHARARGIRVCNAAGTNEECVADHAMMLLLAATRRLPFLNTGVRRGLWRDQIPRPPNVSFKRMAILGLGGIGRCIARRAEGFHMEIGYRNRKPRQDVPYRYFEDLHEMACWCDYLVVAAPAGPQMEHVINASVLEALGPAGVLVNISRGSLVDTQALADALRQGVIFAAGLDVYEGEPRPPEPLLDLDNAVLTPHIAGISPEAIHASVVKFLENAQAHFSGEPLLTPVD